MNDDFYDLFKTPPPAQLTIVPGEIPTGDATSYAAAALRRECADVASMAPNTGRNHRLNVAAFRMGRHIGAGNIDAGTVRAALEQAGRACGLPEHEIQTVLRDDSTSGITNGTSIPRYPTPRSPIPEPTILATNGHDVLEGEDVSRIIRERLPIIDWHELWNTEDEEEDWIVEPILPARRLVALFSAPKVGKSLLMLEVAVAVARGETVLGVTPQRPHRVLYVDFENDPRGDVRTRLQAMGITPDDLANLCYLSYPNLAKLDTAAGAQDLMYAVAEYECEVVVIDTISRAVGGEENENDTWLSFYRHTGLSLKQAGIACIRLDHTGKDHEKGMRGGSAKYGDVDAVWKLSKVTEDTFKLECTDHRMKVTESTLVLKRGDNPLRHEVAGEGRKAAWDARIAEVIATLDAAKAPASMGRDGAKIILRDAGMKVGTDALSEAIKQRKMRLGYAPQEEM